MPSKLAGAIVNHSSANSSPKLQNLSVNLLFLGIVLLFGTQGYHTVLPDSLRIAILVCGFFLIIFAAALRFRSAGRRYMGLLALSLITGVALMLIQIMLDQQTLGTRDLLFQLVVFSLFLAGAIIGGGVRHHFPQPNSAIILIAIFLIVPGLYAFIDYAAALSETSHRHLRSFDDIDGMSPIGVAYAAAILIIVYFRISVSGSNIGTRIASSIMVVVLLSVLIFTGSRGVIVFLGLTAVALVWVTSRDFGKIMDVFFSSGKAIRFLSSIVALLFAGGLLWYLFGEIMSERWEWFVRRFDGLLPATGGFQERNQSVQMRVEIWGFYLANWFQAIPLGMRGYEGYPHNLFIELFARFGLVGIVFAMYIVSVFIRSIYLMKRLSRDFINNGEILMVFAIFTFALLQSLTSLNLEMNRALFLGLGYFSGLLMFNRLSSGRSPNEYATHSGWHRVNTLAQSNRE